MIHIIVGTEAELIKVIPVLNHLKENNIEYNFISTGQNNITKSYLYNYFNIKSPNFILYTGKQILTPLQMLVWFFRVLISSIFKIKKIFKNDKSGIVLVHGDTVSTVLGAMLGKISRNRVGHIEAGLRSFDFFNPFPEEICRNIVSFLADIHFCPGEWALNNLRNIKGKKVNIKENTLLDTLRLTLSKTTNKKALLNSNENFFIFSIHRQENIYDKNILKSLIGIVIENSKNMKCLFIIFAITKKLLISSMLWEKINNNPDIILTERMKYADFIHLLNKSEFIVTDGGSNQEETYYLGKPCLILRKKTERKEGLNRNVVISNLDFNIINDFFLNYRRYSYAFLQTEDYPSKTIVEDIYESDMFPAFPPA